MEDELQYNKPLTMRFTHHIILQQIVRQLLAIYSIGVARILSGGGALFFLKILLWSGALVKSVN